MTADYSYSIRSLMQNSDQVDPALAETSGALPVLWLSAAIIGNLFALYWLLQALRMSMPDLSLHTVLRNVQRQLSRGRTVTIHQATPDPIPHSIDDNRSNREKVNRLGSREDISSNTRTAAVAAAAIDMSPANSLEQLQSTSHDMDTFNTHSYRHDRETTSIAADAIAAIHRVAKDSNKRSNCKDVDPTGHSSSRSCSPATSGTEAVTEAVAVTAANSKDNDSKEPSSSKDLDLTGHSSSCSYSCNTATAGSVAQAVAIIAQGAATATDDLFSSNDMDLIDHATLEKLKQAGTQLQPAALEWDGVGCTRKTPAGKVKVLQGISGSAAPGHMMALLGSSGAGKSTLLDILAMRCVGGAGSKVHGVIKVNGRTCTDTIHSKSSSTLRAAAAVAATPAVACSTGTAAATSAAGASQQVQADGATAIEMGALGSGNGNVADCGASGTMSKAEFLRLSAYVPQEDHLLPQMTVLEVLQFHAVLLLPPGTSKEQRRQCVEHALAVMGLQNQAATMVGGTLLGGLVLRGISGGERRRLAIAAGVLAGPSLIFLDEPSSGLDSFSALSVAAYLQALASAGHTLVVSIHQPRAAIWGMFNKVLLLSMGRMMFEGTASDMVPWFTGPQMQYRYEPAHHGVPSDWVIDLVAGGTFKTVLQSQQDNLKPPPEQQPYTCMGLHTSSFEVDTAAACAAGGAVAVQGASCTATGTSTGVMETAQDVEQAAVTFDKHRAKLLNFQGDMASDVDPYATQLVVSASAGSTCCRTGGQDGEQRSMQHFTAGLHASGTIAEPGVVLNATETAGGAAEASGCSWHATVEDLRSWNAQFKALFWKESLVVIRNPADAAGRMLLFVWISLFSNMILYNAGGDAASINQRVTWLFAVLFFYLVIPYVFISLFTADKRAFLADMGARLYSPGPYFAAKVLSTLPINALISVLFGWIAYGMFGFRHSALSWIQNTACSVLFSLISLQWMHFATCITPNQDVAFALALAFTVFNLLLNGYFHVANKTTQSLGWTSKLKFLSAMNWSWEGVMLAEFGGRVFHCSLTAPLPTDIMQMFPEMLPRTPSLALIRSGVIDPPNRQDCVASGDAVLHFYQISGTVGSKLGFMLLYLAILYVLTYGGLLYSTSKRQGG